MTTRIGLVFLATAGWGFMLGLAIAHGDAIASALAATGLTLRLFTIRSDLS